MIQKGYMQPVKKILGAVVGIAGVGMVLGIDAINNIISQNQLPFGIVLLTIAYFMVISGRQL
jgi:hypothetical protein